MTPTIADSPMPFVVFLFGAPLTARSRRWPRVLHAVTLDGLIDGYKSGRWTFTAACGRTSLRLEGRPTLLDPSGNRHANGPYPVPWPPSTRGLPADMERCRDCWIVTGKPHPRVVWTGKEAK